MRTPMCNLHVCFILVPVKPSGITPLQYKYTPMNVDGNSAVLEQDMDAHKDKPWRSPGAYCIHIYRYSDVDLI